MSLSKPSVLEGEYKVDQVVGVRRSKRGREVLVRWKDYNFLGDTWEPEEHVAPSSKVKKYDAGIPVTVDARWHLHALRNAIASHLTSRKIGDRRGAHRLPVRVAALACPDLARAVLHHMRCMVSPPVKLEQDEKGDTFVELWNLDHIGALVALHLVRPQAGHGNLRIHSGGVSHQDMMMVIPPFRLTMHEPAAYTSEVPIFEGAWCEMELCTVTFNGKTGEPGWPKIADKAEQHSTAERNVLVDHAKLVLKQTWSTDPVKHELMKKGWDKLPSSTWKLPAARAMPA